MTIDFVDVTTLKQVKLDAEWNLKQYKKKMKIFCTEFSHQERLRVDSCKEGKTTVLLRVKAFMYFDAIEKQYKTFEHLSVNRPSTRKLIGEEMYNSMVPYFNRYFASWFYKKNWNSLVTDYLSTCK